MPTTAWSGRASSTSTPISTRATSGRAAPIPTAASWARSTPSGGPRGELVGGDVAARMDFALRCALRTAPCAIRTHLDSRDDQTASPGRSSPRCARHGRAASRCRRSPLFSIDFALDDGAHGRRSSTMVGRHRPDARRRSPMRCPQLQPASTALFRLAVGERAGTSISTSTKRSIPSAALARAIAETALRIRLPGQHRRRPLLLALASSPTTMPRARIDLVAKAGIAVVSLPMCNMYLQSREAGRTPRSRGVTLLHELAAAGVNGHGRIRQHARSVLCLWRSRLVEVYREATRIAHLDHPVGDWPRAFTCRARRGAGAAIWAAEGGARPIWSPRARRLDASSCRARRCDRTVLRGGKRHRHRPAGLS